MFIYPYCFLNFPNLYPLPSPQNQKSLNLLVCHVDLVPSLVSINKNFSLGYLFVNT